MDYKKLKNEIDTDPLARGYSGMTNLQVADDLNTIYRTINRERMSATEILNTVDTGEWALLSDEEKRRAWDVLHMGGGINPFGNEATIFIGVFGAGSNTILALADARRLDVSRAIEIELGETNEGDVEKARAI